MTLGLSAPAALGGTYDTVTLNKVLIDIEPGPTTITLIYTRTLAGAPADKGPQSATFTEAQWSAAAGANAKAKAYQLLQTFLGVAGTVT